MLIETNDKTNILYYFDQNHNFDVSDLNDYDENFIIEMNQGTLTKIDIHCHADMEGKKLENIQYVKDNYG